MSRFFCRIVLAYPVACDSEMDDYGGSIILGMVKVESGASSTKTGLFTIIFFQFMRRDGTWMINSWMPLSF